MDLIRAFYPKRCPVCEKILSDIPGEEKKNICLECNSKLKYIQAPRCFVCGKQLYNENQEYCTDCQGKEHLFKQGVGVFGYDEKIKYSIYRFKYSNKREYAKFFGEVIAVRYGHIIRRWNPDVIIPIPLYKIKYLQRGYNQAELIAKELGYRINVPLDTHLLKRCRRTKAMKELNDEERVKNLQNAFKLSENIVKYNKILLVDDIYTTGATIDACAKVLIEGGAKEIYYASACIGNGF